MLTGLRLAIIGAGNMAEALVRGLLNAGAVKKDQVVVTDPRQERREFLVERFGVEAIEDNAAAAESADVVILAVKPQIMKRVGLEIASSIQSHALVISIAAGVSVRAIASTLGAHVRICRTMPNICAVVDRAATAIAPGPNAHAEDVARVRTIFESVGMVEEVEESLMDAVTGLSGSGPSYIFMIIEALADAGVRVGLPRYLSQTLAAHTVLGSARLLIETGEHPGVLKDQVTSPGGAAIAGLHTLEAGGLRTTLIDAVVAASDRSRDLGEED